MESGGDAYKPALNSPKPNQLALAGKNASIERGGRGRARIITDKPEKDRRQSAQSASSAFYEHAR
jgi:hypothetical protein